MGILFSRFRKKKTTIEILDELDKKIKEIEQYGQNTEQRHKKIVGTLIIYSVALYIITAGIFYFYFFPAELYDQVLYIAPLLMFPILILFVKKMVSWYYKRKISRNQETLSTMQQQKKKILDEVTETETYKKAKEILMKFAPDQLRMTPLSPQTPSYKQTPTASETPKIGTPQAIVSPLQGGPELRRRVLTSQNLTTRIGPPVQVVTAPSQTPVPSTPYRTSGKITHSAVTPAPKTPLPRPILPQQRSYIDRLVEYVVGDGPNNRYALICRQCDSHNGMALKEEFEYFAFRCCYCNFWNPARKQKPSAPKLEFDNAVQITPQRLVLKPSTSTENLTPTNTNETEIITNLSDTDSDIEVVEKPSITPNSEESTAGDEIENEEVETEEPTVESEPSTVETEVVKDDQVESEKMDVDESPKK